MDNKVLAIVNGKEITQNDVISNIPKFPREQQQQLNTEQGQKYVLDQLISFEVMYNSALESDTDKDENYLAQLEIAKKEILTKTYINNLLSDVNVPDNELEAFYFANKNMFVAPESVTASHILVDSKEKADDIKSEIENGKSFEDAAKEYSSCPSSAEGGNLGSFMKGQMVPEFEKCAFSLEAGIVSEPVKTQFGYHLIKVASKNNSTQKSFKEVKEFIKQNLIQEKQNLKFSKTVDELSKKYKVEVM